MIKQGSGVRGQGAGIVARNLTFIIMFIFITLHIFAQSGDFYWEEPVPFSAGTGSFPVSAYSGSFAAAAWQEASPNRNPNIAADGYINVHLAVKEPESEWQQKGIVAGPYSYSGTEPSILSIVIDNRGRILIAAAAASSQIEILISADRGNNFSRQTINISADNSVAPRIFVRADGGYLLFVARSLFQSLSIYYSRSDNGIHWSSFELFTPESGRALNFLPAHASIGNRDIVFYQSISAGIESSSLFQLFYKISEDGGETWTTAKRFTDFYDPVIQTRASPDSFDNQRPHLTRYGNNLLLVWERRYTTQSPQIYSAVIDADGNLTGHVERVNSEEAYCNNPIGFIFNNNPEVVWFDNRTGNNRVIFARRWDSIWQNFPLSSISTETSFARPVVSGNEVYIFWQGRSQNTERIYILSPDHSVISPQITALNFDSSIPSRSERVRVAWDIPSDPSGILGFSWTWSQNQNVQPPNQIMIYNTGNAQNMNMELYADRDGVWYFSISAHDFAGNWSAPSRIAYNRKTVPPPPLILIEPEKDENGFLVSNTFDISWLPSTDPFVAGYTWNLRYAGSGGQAAAASLPAYIMGTENFAGFENHDNGIWEFSAAAVDLAGNIGQPSAIVFRTNKYIPYTTVNYVDTQIDEHGILSLRIIGRGFSTDGIITSVVLAQEGRPDLTEDFNILSDREIGGLILENIEDGEYYLRLEHSTRGWYTTAAPISITGTGTIKYGDYSREWKPSWTVRPRGKINFTPITILAAILVIFSIIGSAAAIKGIGGVIAESAAIKQETSAILTGDFMLTEKKRKIVQIQKKGGSLRSKLASFTIGLVLLVVIGISTPIYFLMTNMQRETLLQSLWDRSKVLLEGLATSARAYMPLGEQGALEMGFLPAQSAALPEARYVTITGYIPGSIFNDHVLATNDPDINSKVDTAEFRRGVSRINDSLSPYNEQLSAELNYRARTAAGNLPASIAELYQEGLNYTLRTDAEGIQRLNDIQTTISSFEVRLSEILSEVAGEIRSYPVFSVENIEKNKVRDFIFYKPVMYRQGTEDNYLRGLIRLEVSLDSIMDTIFRRQMVLLRTITIVAVIAILTGIAGALILSALIIKPIKKLVSHIEIIRDTEDKAKLAGVDINIATNDELAILGSTINDMTYGLVKAALAASDLSIGKEIQKKFIPLETDSSGNKLTSGIKITPNLDFFGYYEGAKGVSGDYFDYLDLDGRYYAIIKCDVAGKGIPAALIMIQVATMFINHFKQWKPGPKGMQIEELVYQINGFIETLGFKGRFAAFSLCIFDSATGIARFCNAGDNIIRLYDASEGRLRTITLPQTPATGVLPNSMIESTGGYKVQTLTVENGDILLLYTDGIEEAKRKFRSSDFKEITCTEGPVDTPHENHLCGQSDEEMGQDRVEDIINAVMARKTYTLKKYHNPEGDTELQFDFSTCENKVEDVIMAMVSVEKMFRCYKNPADEKDSSVLVDKKVDNFLKNHFLQYRRYCSHKREYPENDAYLYYTGIKEDEQYDDLTILGIKRK